MWICSSTESCGKHSSRERRPFPNPTAAPLGWGGGSHAAALGGIAVPDPTAPLPEESFLPKTSPPRSQHGSSVWALPPGCDSSDTLRESRRCWWKLRRCEGNKAGVFPFPTAHSSCTLTSGWQRMSLNLKKRAKQRETGTLGYSHGFVLPSPPRWQQKHPGATSSVDIQGCCSHTPLLPPAAPMPRFIPKKKWEILLWGCKRQPQAHSL